MSVGDYRIVGVRFAFAFASDASDAKLRNKRQSSRRSEETHTRAHTEKMMKAICSKRKTSQTSTSQQWHVDELMASDWAPIVVRPVDDITVHYINLACLTRQTHTNNSEIVTFGWTTHSKNVGSSTGPILESL